MKVNKTSGKEGKVMYARATIKWEKNKRNRKSSTTQRIKTAKKPTPS